jgi:putative membrane protein
MMILDWIVQTFRALSLLARIFLLGWLVEMILVPILRWRWGERAMRAGLVVGVVMQGITVILILSDVWTWGRTLSVVLMVAVLTWIMEFIGSHTGLPFGRYHYTDRLQPQLGNVPLIIPLAWLMMLPPAWATADLIVGTGVGWFAFISGLAFTAWDLFLDPQMVRWNFWQWTGYRSETSPNKGEGLRRRGEGTRGYFGIPWSNFVGWWLTAWGLTALIGPTGLPAAPLFLIYVLTWFLETFGQFVFWHWPGTATGGLVGMGVFVIGAWLRGIA